MNEHELKVVEIGGIPHLPLPMALKKAHLEITKEYLADQLIEMANIKYSARKVTKGQYDPDSHEPPPVIANDQVVAILEVLADVLVSTGRVGGEL